jgi:hypothetical protein
MVSFGDFVSITDVLRILSESKEPPAEALSTI